MQDTPGGSTQHWGGGLGGGAAITVGIAELPAPKTAWLVPSSPFRGGAVPPFSWRGSVTRFPQRETRQNSHMSTRAWFMQLGASGWYIG